MIETGQCMHRESGARLIVVDAGTDQVDMTGTNLVRHHLQQAAAAAGFLPGGDSAPGGAGNALAAGAALDAEEASELVRASLERAIAALDDIDGATT